MLREKRRVRIDIGIGGYSKLQYQFRTFQKHFVQSKANQIYAVLPQCCVTKIHRWSLKITDYQTAEEMYQNYDCSGWGFFLGVNQQYFSTVGPFYPQTPGRRRIQPRWSGLARLNLIIYYQGVVPPGSQSPMSSQSLWDNHLCLCTTVNPPVCPPHSAPLFLIYFSL